MRGWGGGVCGSAVATWIPLRSRNVRGLILLLFCHDLQGLSIRTVCEYGWMESSNHKGAVAELEIATAAVKLGVPVFRPLSEHSRADLVLEVGGQLLRVQCKWGRLSEERDVVSVATGGSRFSPRGYVLRTLHGARG